MLATYGLSTLSAITPLLLLGYFPRTLVHFVPSFTVARLPLFFSSSVPVLLSLSLSLSLFCSRSLTLSVDLYVSQTLFSRSPSLRCFIPAVSHPLCLAFALSSLVTFSCSVIVASQSVGPNRQCYPRSPSAFFLFTLLYLSHFSLSSVSCRLCRVSHLSSLSLSLSLSSPSLSPSEDVRFS